MKTLEKASFKKAFIKKVEEVSGEDFSESTAQHQYEALSELVMEEITAEWAVNNSRLHTFGGGRLVRFWLFCAGTPFSAKILIFCCISGVISVI